MKKIFFLFMTAGIILLTQTETKAQDYKNAIGGRFGASNGITFKTFIADNKGLDFILNFRNTKTYSRFSFTGLYEVYAPLNLFPESDGLKWYYGGGGSIGSYKYKPTNSSDLAVSVDGVIGLDYKFKDAPI